ncbi:hypothetical protein [Pedosphaera parvula]|uniref:Uncharacterized protein n=1 Tax=Pedosphaera parvula (strain Ellin514) TaxID=320771 RepID=B9XR19_PEDPL|nr:hypothetical protein [Pedosphaera parvula]EEF57715.1 hypothetical protein Cflav_PD0777 [Pedosphaera parvula Ellin514]
MATTTLITKTALRKIYDSLDASFFSAASFRIDTPQKEVFARIHYLDNDSYYFLFYEKDGNMSVQFSPGELKNVHTERIHGLDGCIDKISDWCVYIQRELKTGNPFYDELEKVKAEFAEKLNNHFSDATAHFSSEEAAQLHSRFDELLQKFGELKKQNGINEEELRKVKETVATLQRAIEEVPKKTWYRSAGNKLMDLSKKFLQSKQGQQLIANVGEKLLTGGQPQSPEL